MSGILGQRSRAGEDGEGETWTQRCTGRGKWEAAEGGGGRGVVTPRVESQRGTGLRGEVQEAVGVP